GGVDAEGSAGGVRGPPAKAYEHSRRSGPHQVQRGLVGGGTAYYYWHVEVVDELLEVERFGVARDMLGAHCGAADHDQVDARLEDGLVVRLGPVGAERPCDGDARVANLAQARLDELVLDALSVNLLHAGRHVAGVEFCDLVK